MPELPTFLPTSSPATIANNNKTCTDTKMLHLLHCLAWSGCVTQNKTGCDCKPWTFSKIPVQRTKLDMQHNGQNDKEEVKIRNIKTANMLQYHLQFEENVSGGTIKKTMFQRILRKKSSADEEQFFSKENNSLWYGPIFFIQKENLTCWRSEKNPKWLRSNFSIDKKSSVAGDRFFLYQLTFSIEKKSSVAVD